MNEDLANIKTIKDILAANKFAPLKNLGQNFLIDHNTLVKIAEAGELSAADLVLEIGPGLGALTQQLALRAGQVVAVEYDRGLFGVLQTIFAAQSRVQLLNADFLQVNLEELLAVKPVGINNFKVVANLPYYITTPLIFKLLEASIPWKSMVFLVQKEVAQRICAVPGNKNYGALTVMLNYYGATEQIGIVSKNVFYPAPQVDSAIVRITPNWSQVTSEIYGQLRQVVQAAFSQRRKTLANTLMPLFQNGGGKAECLATLARAGIDSGRRGETLTVTEFLVLAESLKERK